MCCTWILRPPSRYFQASEGAQIRVIEGDLSIDGNLLLDWDEKWGSDGLIVTGNLTVSGSIINASGDSGPFLLVGGQSSAHAIVGGGAELVFEGDAEVADIVIGHYNDGILEFGSNLTAPAVVTMDHYLVIDGELDGRWFDVFDRDDKWSAFLDMRRAEFAIMEEDEWRGLDDALFPVLKAGHSVLRPDLPPKEEYTRHW
ncbi:hypothetical protein SAMN05216210_2109 [Halopseudomonas salegens]|uniref:Polymer-forming protein n=2 Tax=Halopseudomonas salegens TaxID=1434072 RepID=A0A1H2G8D6_9GAMM|nr:hypothetical protein SAMN05216210_2109 [Halopseudomonas salegens]